MLTVGSIFSVKYEGYHHSGIKYWKVTSIGTDSCNIPFYNVIRCTKTGKEFLEVNSFSCIIDNYFGKPESIYNIVKLNGPVGNKVDFGPNERGLKIGAMKRRISFLQNRIDKDTKELAELMLKLQSV